MKKLENNFLFLVVLGGRAKKANIELHDVRWVIGSSIEDTYDVLRSEWFGTLEGLHIDSYKKINYVDGYKICLRNVRDSKLRKKNFFIEKNTKKNLWFVNIGGYDVMSMQEQHEFGLIVASSSLEAKNIAKSKWLKSCKKKHKDDISKLKIFSDFDNCQMIKKFDNWEIELLEENSPLPQRNDAPDWIGYIKIDGM